MTHMLSAFGGKKHLPLILILIAGTLLRFYHNLDISLWHDEAFSALLIKYNWSEMMYRIGLDVHPPMYYIFLRVWHYLFGDSLLALRSFTILFSVGTIWAAWLFVKSAFKSEKTAAIAAFLVAINPFQIQYATEARMYTMGAFFSVLASYFLVRALEEQRNYYIDQKLNIPNLPKDLKLWRNFLWHYAGFVICVAIIILTHYYLLFTAAALCLYALVYHVYHYRANFKRYLLLATSYLLLIFSFVPWLQTFLYQARQVGAGYWIPPMDKWSIPSTIWTIVLGFAHDANNIGAQKWLILICAIVVVLVVWFLKKTDNLHKWLVLFAILAPFVGSLLFLIMARLKGSNTSVYLVRYFLFMSAFLSVLIAVWLKELKYKWLAFVLFLTLAFLNLDAFYIFWRDLNIKTRPGMAAAAKYLSANVEPNQKVFVNTSFEFFNYKYYSSAVHRLPAGVRPLLYSGGERQAKNISHIAGSAILIDADLAPAYNENVLAGQTAWIVWTHAFGSGPPNVPQSWQQISHVEYPDIRPYVGTSIHVSQYRVN